MERFKYWNVVGIAVTLFIATMSWGISVEVRMAQHTTIQHVQESVDSVNVRLQNMEKLLLPMIVDYRVNKQLEEAKQKGVKKPLISREATQRRTEEDLSQVPRD